MLRHDCVHSDLRLGASSRLRACATYGFVLFTTARMCDLRLDASSRPRAWRLKAWCFFTIARMCDLRLGALHDCVHVRLAA
jgi:hypothetical protein